VTYLLDTHVVIWWWTDAPELPARFAVLLDRLAAASEMIGISTISLWEIAMLVERRRLELFASVDTFLAEIESHAHVRMLPITACVAAESTRMGPSYPRDPVDRIIGATARCHHLRLVTADQAIRDSGAVAFA
jgi:PIN domain nuclease of toxin-antitoxin system